MRPIEPFDPATLPLTGIRLVEASAGTGKTFSLAGLYLRLIVERRLDVREILVMTFTRAATQELRERLRERLARAARISAEPAHDDRPDAADAFAERVIAAAGEDRATVAARLRDAATRVDQATITTIHGFAQKAGGENAFESSLPFDRGEQVDDAELLREACADYWRTHVFGGDPRAASAFLQLWSSPEELFGEIEEILRKPHARLVTPDLEALERDRQQALADWPADRDAFVELLERVFDADGLRKNEPLRALVEAEGAEALAGAIDLGLSGTADGYPALLAVFTDLGDDAGVLAHAKQAACKWFRPQDLDSMPLIARLQVQGRLACATQAIRAVRERAAALKRERRLYSFDDMIAGLHAAITDERHGPDLAAALRRTWPFALVDEFQDTDPTQYAILRHIYGTTSGGPGLTGPSLGPSPQGGASRRFAPGESVRSAPSGLPRESDPVARMEPQAEPGDEASSGNHGLILIGDPKQAIYGFRGGDVFAYLEAAADADGQYGMDTNHRSTRAVLDGLDALFTKAGDAAFVLDGIAFRHVEAGRGDGDRIIRFDGEELAGVTAWSIPEEAGAAKGAVEPRIRQATIERIAALLDDDRATVSEADADDRPLHSRDIAVLVNSNFEAADMQKALVSAGVPAVCIHQDSVFATEAAQHLLRLLRAAAVPFDRDRLRVALTTPLFGYRLGDIADLDRDEQRWTALTERFQAAHLRWGRNGVQAMAEPFLQDAAARVVGLHDGERRMTDYLHVVERLQEAQHEVFGREGLVHWLEEAIRGAVQDGAERDADRLRLENDSDLVQVTTVHKAKGLQFPIVFLPFAPWLGTGGNAPTQPPYNFHDEHNRAVVDLGSIDAGHHQPQALRERRAEQVRSLYVALTRAEQACFFAWGAVNKAANSPLAWLLHREDGADLAEWHGDTKLPAWFDAATVEGRLAEVRAASGGGFRVETLPDPESIQPPRLAGDTAALGPAREDLPSTRSPWSVFSFSRLAGRMTAVTEAAGADDADDTTAARAPVADPEIPVHPRGTGFGLAFHELMETVDFATWPSPGETLDETRRTAVARALRRHGVFTSDARGEPLPVDLTADLVGRTLHTALPEIGPLTAVDAASRRAEIEFFLRLGGSRVRELMNVITAAGPGGGGADETVLRGLMQGYIDLVVEADGRYWVLDYKTNALGPMRADYAPARLAESVRHHHYDLQYLIYTVALHRYLQQRLDGYDPAQHLGGVQYLFVRGMQPGDSDTGIHVDRPSVELIEQLDALFDAEGVAA